MSVKKFLAAIICAMFLSIQACSAAEVLASTGVKEGRWSLSIVKTDEGNLAFVILNQKENNGAWIDYSRALYNFYLNKSPVIFAMAVTGSPHDVDERLGEWRENVHVVPVYANFSYSKNSGVLPEPYPTSGAGLKPSHYQARIMSVYHRDLIEVFLTYLPELHKIVEQNKIVLP